MRARARRARDARATRALTHARRLCARAAAARHRWVQYVIPLQAALMCFEDVTLSIELHDETESRKIFLGVCLIHSWTIPVFIIIMFEAGYLIHKRRSIRFCGIAFEDKQRVRQSGVLATVLRFWVRVLALVVLALGFGVNLRKPNLVGVSYFLKRVNAGGAGGYVALALVPPAVLALVGMTISILIWNFGTYHAMTVHSTWCNGWGAMFVGSLVQICSLFAKTAWYPAASALGEVALLIGIMYTFRMINTALNASVDFEEWLEEAATPQSAPQYSGESPMHPGARPASQRAAGGGSSTEMVMTKAERKSAETVV